MTFPHRRSAIHRLTPPACALLLSVLTLALSGCGSFFSCEGKSECPTGGTGSGTNTGDYIYVSDSTTSNTDINGYAPASSSLTATTSSPYGLDIIPSAIAITPTNSYMYIASNSSTGNIYGFTIGDGGLPTILSDNGTKALLGENVAAMDVSPDGDWLFLLDSSAQQINVYTIETSTGYIGALTATIPLTLASAAGGTYTPLNVKVSPSGDFVVCSLGLGGANVFPFNTSTGANTGPAIGIIPANNQTGIYAAAWDKTNYLYTVGTAGLQTFSVNSTTGQPTQINTYTTGAGAKSIVINSNSTDLYVGNQTDGTISAFSIGTAAALTAIGTAAVTGPPSVSQLAINSTGNYLIAAGYDTSKGLELFNINATTGALTLGASAGTGSGTSAPTINLATTH